MQTNLIGHVVKPLLSIQDGKPEGTWPRNFAADHAGSWWAIIRGVITSDPAITQLLVSDPWGRLDLVNVRHVTLTDPNH